MECSWSVDRTNGVTLVRCRLRNDRDVACRVRIESRLDGPVLAPRRNGVPESGWDRSGVTVRLDPGDRRAVGFASPARPAEPPVTVEVTDVGGEPDVEKVDAREAVRRLDTHRPPADAIERLNDEMGPDGIDRGRGGMSGSADGGSDDDAAGDGSDDDGSDDESNDDQIPDGEPNDDRTNDEEPTDDERIEPGRAHERIEPDAVDERIDEWFAAIERRIERGERLDDADLATATEAVAAAGGVPAVGDLDRALTDDAARLRRLSERAASLAARAEATEVPADAMETLA